MSFAEYRLYELYEIIERAENLKSFRFRTLDGDRVPAFSAGAHVLVTVPGPHERQIRNAYTLTSPPGDRSHFEITVQLEPDGRGGSRHLHEVARAGMIYPIRAPINLFGLENRAHKHLFVAGGIGITPIRALMSEAERRGENWELHYGFRGVQRAGFLTEINTHDPRITLWDSMRSDRLDLTRILSGQPFGTKLYICGPERLVEGARSAALAKGWPASSILSEEFVRAGLGLPFSARLLTGQILEVGPTQSLLEALEDAGHPQPYMCRMGQCGQCRIGLRPSAGKTLHRDGTLTDAERQSGNTIIPCVSRHCGGLLQLAI
ncbi:PDR/VanB family oxidoreductase [Agrobacterium sp. T29]|uniref:PDR/VanB family oxidoreductase n=1 Tax=Agrobacterium sp. T29 TaxID=2580515 RepID=UPI00115DD626|nr:PDR/VanB family oxidoreductase [Agrobacterium sp. T29]